MFLMSLDELILFISNNKDSLSFDIIKLDEKFKAVKDLNILWKEFYQGLIKDSDGEYHLCDDASKYFNSDTMLNERVNSKIIGYIPQLFVGIGITGTFLGLTIGLSSLSGDNIFVESQSLIAEKMSTLISGVSTSFFTSLYGLYYSIAFSIFINFYFGEYQRKVSTLRGLLNYIFNKNLTAKSIEKMNSALKEANIMNKNLHKDISEHIEKKLETIRSINEKTFNNINNEITNVAKLSEANFIDFSKQSIENNENFRSQLISYFNELSNYLFDNYSQLSSNTSKNLEEIKKITESTFTEISNKFTGYSNSSHEKFKDLTEFSKTNNQELNKTIQKAYDDLSSRVYMSNQELNNRLINMIDDSNKQNQASIIHIMDNISKNHNDLVTETKSLNRDLVAELSNIQEQAKGINNIFVNELKRLNDTFKITLSDGLRDIFENDFLVELQKIKTQIIEYSHENIEALETSRSLNAKINNDSLEASIIIENISDKLNMSFEKVYSNDFFDRTEDIKNQLEDILNNSNINILEYANTTAKVNEEILILKNDIEKISDRLNMSLNTLLSDDFTKSIEDSKKAFSQYNNSISSISKKILSSYELNNNKLEDNTLILQKMENSFMLIESKFSSINNNIEQNLDVIFSNKHLEKIKSVYQNIDSALVSSSNVLSNFEKSFLDMNTSIQLSNHNFKEIVNNIQDNLSILKDPDLISSIKSFKDILINTNDSSVKTLEKNIGIIDSLTKTLSYIDLNMEKVLGNSIDQIERFEENISEFKNYEEKMFDKLSDLNKIIHDIPKIIRKIEAVGNDSTKS